MAVGTVIQYQRSVLGLDQKQDFIESTIASVFHKHKSLFQHFNA